MWLDDQNLNLPRRNATGQRWHFRVWYDIWTQQDGRVVSAYRVFFWNDQRDDCGVVLVQPDSPMSISRLRGLIQKLAADPALRAQHKRDLRFPLERHYAEHGAFPEEQGR